MSEDNMFTWTPQQEKAFESIKREIDKTSVKVPITLQVDASTGGLGVVLLQDQIPIAFASKTPTGPDTPTLREKC